MDRWSVMRIHLSLECQGKKDFKGFQGHKEGREKKALLVCQEEQAFLGGRVTQDIQADTVVQG